MYEWLTNLSYFASHHSFVHRFITGGVYFIVNPNLLFIFLFKDFFCNNSNPLEIN